MQIEATPRMASRVGAGGDGEGGSQGKTVMDLYMTCGLIKHPISRSSNTKFPDAD